MRIYSNIYKNHGKPLKIKSSTINFSFFFIVWLAVVISVALISNHNNNNNNINKEMTQIYILSLTKNKINVL